jgi:hypothetical protein
MTLQSQRDRLRQPHRMHGCHHSAHVNTAFMSADGGQLRRAHLVGGAQSVPAGLGDAFISRFNATLTTLLQSTYFGGGAAESAQALAVHPTLDRVYIAGRTESASLPGTSGAPQTALAEGRDAFIASFNGALTSLQRSSFFGGTGDETAYAIAIGPGTSDVFTVGDTNSSDLPAVVGGIRPFYSGGSKAFVARFDTALGTILQATYLGGSVDERGYAVAVHPVSGEVYVSGETTSGNFPGTAGAHSLHSAGAPETPSSPGCRAISKPHSACVCSMSMATARSISRPTV